MAMNIGGSGANKAGSEAARGIMPKGGGTSSVVRGSNRAPKGPNGAKLIGGPSPEFRQTMAGTKRYDLGDKSLSRGRRM